MINIPDINKVLNNFEIVSEHFPRNETTKNAFLAVCMFIEPNSDLQVINKLAPHGGLIGPGDSRLHKYLKRFKILRTHAAFHDAFGFMKEQYATGPGYVYIVSNIPSHFLFGHVTGVLFWTIFKLVFRSYFDALPF